MLKTWLLSGTQAMARPFLEFLLLFICSLSPMPDQTVLLFCSLSFCHCLGNWFSCSFFSSFWTCTAWSMDHCPAVSATMVLCFCQGSHSLASAASFSSHIFSLHFQGKPLIRLTLQHGGDVTEGTWLPGSLGKTELST